MNNELLTDDQIKKAKEMISNMTNQPWQKRIYSGELGCCNGDYCKDGHDEKLEQFISELLQREKERTYMEIARDSGTGFGQRVLDLSFTAGYNYARKEMKQWAEHKIDIYNGIYPACWQGESTKVLQELLEELK